MQTMERMLAEHTTIGEQDRTWLSSFVREWHVLADTSFSDLILWVPDVDDNIFWAAAQCRPVTGPTALEEDVVGSEIRYEPDSLVVEAYLSRVICETSNNKLQAGIPVDVWAIPIIRHDEVIGILERHTNRMGVRAPGAMEDAYLRIADMLSDMVWHGDFPIDPPSDPTLSPHVGDGLILASAEGLMEYASPNAVSAYRRLGLVGDLIGDNLCILTQEGLGAQVQPVDPTRTAFNGRQAGEYEAENAAGSMRLRILPLTRDGGCIAIVALCRDITDLRYRDRELQTKNAMIRETHHRVKNNLQTVSALLRLQARRATSQEARNDLNDAMSRVQSISIVHEILSRSIDEAAEFDEIADTILQMVGDMAASSGVVRVTREGSFGLVPAKVATSLSLIMTELCQNAIEHGLESGDGAVRVVPQRPDDGGLILDVIDQGVGLADDFRLFHTDSLGTSIVATLAADLHGDFTLFNNPDGIGATSRVVIPAETLAL
ncbi:sensor histidine kinase [Propionibacterium australiense]|uniref:histidine kinase n=1 Tax=Propionibacterium australiense TaxID=119981 RepID=A0A383S312_9ACTN|nr:sensor histidine kinase [Propionibacterium australiense]RLP11662.1 ATPase [Propionibacterium australiense]RLP12175.1 ATPase [Propionibacterium australiense]SYZ32395.1 histidine kinase [Propionibacterium australiense]VEH90300.1 Probable sensor histidine kinase pdtaS [Propionibacterium australiense]